MSSEKEDSGQPPLIEADPATAEKDCDAEKSAGVPDWPEMMVRTEAEEWIPESSVVEEKPEDKE